MRIISGTAKGTKLYTLSGLNTRPTLDRVKEALFNIIQNQIAGSKVLDLFSGSGAIGLEFASRGANEVYLCDKSKEACEIINKNIQKTHLENKTKLVNKDYIDFIHNLQNEQFDIIYLDPPYKTEFIINSIQELLRSNCIQEDTLIIAETDEVVKIENEITKIQVEVIDRRKYGRAHIIFLKKINRKEE